MRPGNNNRRGRNRGQRKQHGGIPNKNQSYDGGGSETRVRGNVYQVLEKYLQLARDAGVSGDRIAAENYLQHADHYYRVIQSMNDGQRPRVGGRDISVADFNVQNVSQGLSAALYTGGQAPQPNLTEGGGGNQVQPQGNAGNSNAGGNGGEEGAAENGDGGDDDNDGDEGGEFQPQQAQEHQGRNQNRDQGRDQNRDQGGRNQRNRYNNNRHNQHGNGQYNQNGAAPEGERPRAEAPSENAPIQASAPAAQVADEQPEYPENLLPQPGAAEAGQESRGEGPRGRGRPLRTRRPRAAGDQPAEPAVPVTEGSD